MWRETEGTDEMRKNYSLMSQEQVTPVNKDISDEQPCFYNYLIPKQKQLVWQKF